MVMGEFDRFESRREKIIEILKNNKSPLTVKDLAVLLGLEIKDAKTLYEDIKHAAKTLYRKSGGREYIAMIPPKCIDCGYEFKKLNRLRKPSKCPRCRSERISPPSFLYVKTK